MPRNLLRIWSWSCYRLIISWHRHVNKSGAHSTVGLEDKKPVRTMLRGHVRTRGYYVWPRKRHAWRINEDHSSSWVIWFPYQLPLSYLFDALHTILDNLCGWRWCLCQMRLKSHAPSTIVIEEERLRYDRGRLGIGGLTENGVNVWPCGRKLWVGKHPAAPRDYFHQTHSWKHPRGMFETKSFSLRAVVWSNFD